MSFSERDVILENKIKNSSEMHLTKLVSWLVKNHRSVALEYMDHLSNRKPLRPHNYDDCSKLGSSCKGCECVCHEDEDNK